jgi:hypothetical protein
VHLGGLSIEATEEDIRAAFPGEPITAVALPTPKEGRRVRSRFAFLTFATEEDRDAFVEKFASGVRFLEADVTVAKAYVPIMATAHAE